MENESEKDKERERKIPQKTGIILYISKLILLNIKKNIANFVFEIKNINIINISTLIIKVKRHILKIKNQHYLLTEATEI